MPDGRAEAISSANYGDVFAPAGHERLVQFELAPHPHFTYRVGEVELTRELVLVRGKSAVLCRWTRPRRRWTRARRAEPAARIPRRRRADRRERGPRPAGSRRGRPLDGASLRLASPAGLFRRHAPGGFRADPGWYRRVTYSADRARGYTGTEELFYPGTFSFELPDGGELVVAAALDEPIADPQDEWRKQRSARRRRVKKARERAPRGRGSGRRVRALVGGGRRLPVRRRARPPRRRRGLSVVRGMGPRLRFIALPGLTLARGRPKDCARARSPAPSSSCGTACCRTSSDCRRPTVTTGPSMRPCGSRAACGSTSKTEARNAGS